MSHKGRAFVARRESKAWHPSREDERARVAVAEAPWWERVALEPTPADEPAPAQVTQPPERVAPDDVRGLVLAALESAPPEGLTFSAIQMATGIPRHSLSTLMRSMAKDREVDAVATFRRRVPR